MSTRGSMILTAVGMLLVLIQPGAPVADPVMEGQTVETHRIRVTNAIGGAVEVSPDGGATWLKIGTVRRPAHGTVIGYAASRWAADGTVAATAVHGIRVRVGPAPGSDRGLLLSIVPLEFTNPPPQYGGFVPAGSGIYTDIPAGTGIFRNLAPFVGNPVFIRRPWGPSRLPPDYVPLIGDRLVIAVRAPRQEPDEVVFENEVGGRVYAVESDGAIQPIARVVRPVRGVGRFDATGYTGVGCINTNHAGTITVSTAPDVNGQPLFDDPWGETRGGFMIQPEIHAREEGRPIQQVMVIGPLDPDGPGLEGMAPLFSGFIGLDFQSRDLSKSYVFQMQVDGGPWEPLPQVVGRNDRLFTATGLHRFFASTGQHRSVSHGVTAFRLLFPSTQRSAISGQPHTFGAMTNDR